MTRPKASFTINQNRTPEEIASFGTLLGDRYQGVELFFPYDKSPSEQEAYEAAVKGILSLHPETERVLHLPFGRGNHLCDPALYPGLEQRMTDAIDFAARFSCDRLTLHLGTVSSGLTRSDAMSFLLGPVGRLADRAARSGMVIALENMPGKEEIGYAPQELLSLITSLSRPNVGVCFDCGHAHVAQDSIKACLATYGPFIQHVHLSDNHGLNDEHRTFGTGTIDFVSLSRAFQALHYERLFTLEILFSNAEDLMDNEELFRARFA